MIEPEIFSSSLRSSHIPHIHITNKFPLVAAMERSEREKESAIRNMDKPKRYEYLVRDGQEDDLDKADASAKEDRAWDDFKDANPRGWGNKKGELGDRNF